MMLRWDDTIVALASAPGSGGRGIVRISGPDVCRVVNGHFVPTNAERWQLTRRAERHPGEWRLRVEVPWPDAPLREGLRVPVDVYWWPTRRSYTGQPLAELHLAGSPPLCEALISQLMRDGCRAARPGEFTLRAFLAGRIDLLQAEAVLGVIDAADHEELNLALTQLAGGISHDMARLRSDLLDLLSDLEAGLDFVDADIEFVPRQRVASQVQAAGQRLRAMSDQAQRRLGSTTRPRVALGGLPNAGKSTLFNALCGQAAALVSDVSGTTRDYLSRPLDRGRLHIDLIDTAGWDATASDIEAVAQQRRDEQYERADLIVWCSDLSVDESAKRRDEQLYAELLSGRQAVLRVGTKADAAGGVTSGMAVSAIDGRGLDALCDRMAALLSSGSPGQRQWLGMTAARCQESLIAALTALDRTADALANGVSDDLLVIELREVLEGLGQIVGAVYTEDVLDRIFSKFCIGK